MPFVATAKYPSAIAGVTDLLNHKNVFSSDPSVTLAGTIAAGDTSISVTAGTGQYLPSDNFVISIDDEIIFISSRSTDALAVGSSGRGYEGSTAASHTAGATVTARVTALAHNQLAVEVNAIETELGTNMSNVPQGGMVLLEEHTASNSAELDFTSCISSSYDEYVIEFVNLIPAQNGVNLGIQFSTNGGSSYDGATNYSFGRLYAGVTQNNPGSGQANSLNAAYLWATSTDLGSAAGAGLCAAIRAYNLNSATYQKQMIAQVMGYNTGSNFYMMFLGILYNQTVAVNAFRVVATSSATATPPTYYNLTSGTVRVYGVAK